MENTELNRNIQDKLIHLAKDMIILTPKQLVDGLKEVIKIVEKNNKATEK